MAEKYFLSNEDLPDVSFVFDLQSLEFTYVDPHLVKQLELKSGTLNGYSVAHHLFPEDRTYLEEYFQDILTGRYRPKIEFRFKSGKQIKWIRLAPFKLKSEAGEVIVGNAEEISAEMNNLSSLQKYANKKDSILNILSHDLRGPLSVVKSMSQSLEKNLQDPASSRLLQTITKAVKQSIDLINDLLDREFLECTEVELVKRRIDIASKLKEYMEEYQNSEWMTHRTFKFGSSDEQVFMYLDESKFMQIMNNMMSNALKFTKEGSVICLLIKKKKATVLFTFTDDGIGIPREYHEEIFQKFSGAGRNGLNGEPTLGLGLYIVKTLVEWHNGKIWFNSKEGKGTTFFVEIPQGK